MTSFYNGEIRGREVEFQSTAKNIEHRAPKARRIPIGASGVAKIFRLSEFLKISTKTKHKSPIIFMRKAIHLDHYF
jgi:hypothetical protein